VDQVPRLARPFVALLVAAMIASALFVWESWPLTSFRLFSHVRTDEQTAWVAKIVRENGTELPYPVDSLDEGFRNFGFRMAEFVDADGQRRAELCRVWVLEAPEVAGGEVAAVRLYERRWLLSDRDGDRARPGAEELIFTCSRDGVRVEG
jgi:hypothetical protein